MFCCFWWVERVGEGNCGVVEWLWCFGVIWVIGMCCSVWKVWSGRYGRSYKECVFGNYELK